MPDPREPLLTADGIRLAAGAPPIDLALRSGEILGLAGLEGHGQEAFLETLCGLHRPHAGTVVVGTAGSGTIPVSGLAQAARHGIAYLPRDRRATGILPGQSVLDNFAIAALPDQAWFGWVRRGSLRRMLADFRDRLSMVYGSPKAAIGTLSGGNQQKVLLARWLACRPRVLLLNDPTRGVDLGTRMKLYEVFRALARDDGIPLVVLSSEIEEVLQLCDRVLVFREQGVACELGRSELVMDRVIAAMFGQEVAA
ncbi:MAG: ATP-binding cassette domain-containing protein [Geminicoccaceae bacterium]